MTDKEFEAVVGQAIALHFDEYIPESKIDDTPHEFSPEFEKKMNKLIADIGRYRRIPRKKLIACIAAAIIAACIASTSVSAVRTAFANFITSIFDTHTDVRSVTDDVALNDFSVKYEIGMDLSEYTLTELEEDSMTRTYVYESEHRTLIFTQYIKKYYDIAVNTEGYEMEQITVDGKEGFYIDMYKQYASFLTWDNGDYVFEILITCDEGYNPDVNYIINVADFVQKVEK